MRWLVPKTTSGRLIALVALALLISQAFSLALFFGERQTTLRGIAARNAINRTVSVAGLVLSTPQDLHRAILRTASGRFVRYSIDGTPIVPEKSGSTLEEDLRRVARDRISGFDGPVHLREGSEYAGRPRRMPRFIRDSPNLNERQRERRFRRWRRRSRRLDWVQVSVELAPNSWLNVEAGRPPTPGRPFWAYLVSALLTALLIGGFAVLAVRKITRPLKALSGAAERLGRGEHTEPLPETGPPEIRQTTQAFNNMNERLTRYVQDRTRMLAAVSHDLRTPLTTLRLRAELIDDLSIRDKIVQTVDEMQAMAEETLAFARDDAANESLQRVDLPLLIDGLSEDLRALGRDVRFTPSARITIPCRSNALKRALRNLIENAIAYGQRAYIDVTEREQDVIVCIDDDGPGIASEDLKNVFKPFYRVEQSRSRQTGGVGLGLAIARTIVQRHGGQLSLANRPEGGLRASVTLPK